MTETETMQLIGLIYELWPSTPQPANPELRITAWSAALAPYDCAEILAAAVSWSRTNRFPPEVAQLCQRIDERAHGVLPSEADAWWACTSQLSTEQRMVLHPMLRSVLAQTGGVNSVAWMGEDEARRTVRSAFFTALNEHRIGSDPELRRAPDSDRELGGPTRIGLAAYHPGSPDGGDPDR
jgi:hypothetical protein